MRKKFKVYYPKDYHDEEKAGKEFKAKNGDMIVMNSNGIFFLYKGGSFYHTIIKLSDSIGRYDIVWTETGVDLSNKGENGRV